MLEITSIKNGFVLDHIKPGSGVKIFNYLDLGKDENEVALIINAKGSKSYRKDIIKIENATEIDFTVLALLSPGITINQIIVIQLLRHSIWCMGPRMHQKAICKQSSVCLLVGETRRYVL